MLENGKGTRDRRKVQNPARTQSKEGSSHPLGGLKSPCHRVRKDTQTSRGGEVPAASKDLPSRGRRSGLCLMSEEFGPLYTLNIFSRVPLIQGWVGV